MKARLWFVLLALGLVIMAGCGSKPEQKPAPGEVNAAAGTHTPAPDESAIPAAKPPEGSGGVRYKPDPSASSAWYVVNETFLSDRLNVNAVGKTADISGEIVVADGQIRESVVQVDLSTLTSDQSRRDNMVRRTLQTASHPVSTYKITGAEGQLTQGQEVPLRIHGELTIAGTTHPVIWSARAKLEGQSLTLNAETTFPMTMFGITPPSIAGFVRVVDEVALHISYVGVAQ